MRPRPGPQPPSLPPHTARPPADGQPPRGRPAAPRPRGIALVMALVVVLLLTTYMSEVFFSSGLEMRAMSNFRDAQVARGYARSAFTALRTGLLQDEAAFFQGYRQLEALLNVTPVPFEDGMLLRLRVQPLDHLYNINQIGRNIRQNTDEDRVRWEFFFNSLQDLNVPPEPPLEEAVPLPAETIQQLYAAVWDWNDRDQEPYTGFPGLNGAEAGAYFDAEPAYTPKNAALDRLSELRLVRGVAESRVPWPEWEARFAALPREQPVQYYITEQVNVNVASRQEIVSFLERVRVTSPLESANNDQVRQGINAYAERAEEIADALVGGPGDAGEAQQPQQTPFDAQFGRQRPVYDQAELTTALRDLGFDDQYGTNELFSVVNEYYRVTVTTRAGDVRATLRAVLHVPRNEADRTGERTEVLWATLE